MFDGSAAMRSQSALFALHGKVRNNMSISEKLYAITLLVLLHKNTRLRDLLLLAVQYANIESFR